MSDNPFERLKQEHPQGISLAAQVIGNYQTAARWLRESAASELNQRLQELLSEDLLQRAHVERTQGGKRWYAVGVELPILKDRINEALGSAGKKPVDKVSFSLGLSLLNGAGDFPLDDAPAHGLYVGVRVQRITPEGTLDRAMHEVVFDACRTRLEMTGHTDWQHRSGGDYWSIFRWCSPPQAYETAKDVAVREYLEGLASLMDSCW
jgi:hypothetical protein